MAAKSPPKKPAAKAIMAPPLIGGGGSAGAGVAYQGNSVPDGRLFSHPPFVGQIQRGYITQHDPSGPFRLGFMYNPNQFVYSHQYNAQLIPTSSLAGTATGGGLPLGTTLNFALLFDRHYEVAYGGDKEGVFQDLKVLRLMTGVVDNGFLISNVLKFTLGLNHVFYGFINVMQFTLGYFSEKMVPMNAQVELSVAYVPPDTAATSLVTGATPLQLDALAGATNSSATPSAAQLRAPGGTRSGNQP